MLQTMRLVLHDRSCIPRECTCQPRYERDSPCWKSYTHMSRSTSLTFLPTQNAVQGPVFPSGERCLGVGRVARGHAEPNGPRTCARHRRALGGRRIVESLTNVHGAGGTPKELDASICKLAPRCSATAAHKRLHPWLGGTLVTLRHCAVGFWWLVVWRKRVVLPLLAKRSGRFIPQEFATIGELGKHVIQAWDD